MIKFTDEEINALVISDTLDLFVHCAKPEFLEELRALGNSEINSVIAEGEPSYILTEENIETLSTIALEDLDTYFSPLKASEGKDLLELINTYLDNSTMYVPYDDPKSSGDFNSLVTQLNAYGVKENERVAQILSFKLQTLRDHFVDKPNSRKRGTRYKAIYRNKKVLEMVRHSLTLILNTEDKTRWLTF